MISILWVNRACDLDEKIRSQWSSIAQSEGVAVVAMGSYARREMAPFSDADILILLSDDAVASGEEVVRGMHGVSQRMSVIARSVSASVAMRETDARSWLSLLESRYVCGARHVYDSLRDELRRDVCRDDASAMLRQLAQYARDRRRQYGDAVRLLEPNIKNSSGALRDIHSIYYDALLRCIRKGVSMDSPPMFPDAVVHADVHSKRIESLREAWGFFLTVRETMHETVGHLHDTLEYDLQRAVADQLGYGPASRKESVESFMRDYYRHARSVSYCFDSIFVARATERRVPDAGSSNTAFLSVGELILPGGRAASCDGDDIVQAFRMYAGGEREFSKDAIDIIDERLHEGDIRTSEKGRKEFDRILRDGKQVASTLRRMNELGFLGRVLPPFDRLVSFFQHNIYHYYTADEHTIKALEKCEALEHEDGVHGTIFRSLQDRSILYYAILFHDIAKPVSLPDHEKVGAEMALATLPDYGRSDIADEVAFAVRHHLFIEKVAFRRNFHDRATLRQFIDVVSTRQRLDVLTLLAYADMSALNPNVMTEWKKAILCELYTLAAGVVDGSDREHDALSGTPQETVPQDVPEGAVKASRERRDPGVTVPELIERVEAGSDVEVLVRSAVTHSEVIVVTRDAPYLLSKLAAVLLASDASVVDANIETRTDGIAVDAFRVVDIIDSSALRPEQEELLATHLRDVIAMVTDTEVLYRRHRDKWKRKILRSSVNPAVRIDVRYHEHRDQTGSEQTIIDVFAPDTYGLLYKLTQVISSFRLNILFAKIGTRVDGVVDSFYVTDVDGNPLTDIGLQEDLRNALLNQIRALVAHLPSDPS